MSGIDAGASGGLGRAGRTALAYCVVSALCVAVTNVYALFGHGARSASMDFMFLYPLLVGAAVFALARVFAPRLPERARKGSRLAYNLYNSGIATLTAAAMLAGIMDIAGTGSRLVLWFRVFGGVFVASAFAAIFMESRRS